MNLNKIALTHRSALNEDRKLVSNERLEFLGDAVLELIVSDWLYRNSPKANEGALSQRRSQIVQTQTLALTAKSLKLDEQLILSKGEEKGGGRSNESILADCFEAVIGAIYLEKGLSAAADFIAKNLLNRKVQVADYKSELQELWQSRHHLAPQYRLLTTTGPEHQKVFKVGVFLEKKLIASGFGRSKQKAEAQAAAAALEKSK